MAAKKRRKTATKTLRKKMTSFLPFAKDSLRHLNAALRKRGLKLVKAKSTREGMLYRIVRTTKRLARSR
jgi:hypothetical protein